jgi:pimeloyl-ACP methyl ester carboxylesterase
VLCFVHGLGVGQAYFDPLARELGGLQLRPDLREQLPIPELALKLEEQLAAPALLVANSMGCQVACELALRRPELVQALALIGPTVDPGARSFLRYGLRLVVDGWFEPPKLTGIVIRDYLHRGPAALVRQARYALADAVEERLPAIEVPAIVLRGAHDPLCPAPWAQQAALLLRTRLVTIPGGGHAVHYSHPKAVAEEIRRLARLAETGATRG